MHISFRIPGKLRGKGRPRFVRKSGHVYTDAKTVAHEGIVRSYAYEAMAGRAPLEGPVRLSIAMRINHTASWSKSRKAAAVYVTGKPDADNVCKLIGDGANGILWKDDSQISQIDFDRRYQNGPEYVDISVYDLNAAPFTKAAA